MKLARACALLVALLPGCALGMHATRVSSAQTSVAEVSAARAERSFGGAPSFRFEGESISGGLATSGSSAVGEVERTTGSDDLDLRMIAQAQTSVATPEPTATDAVDTSGELLIYTALFHVGVYDVEVAQAAIAESARSAGGFVFAQGDDTIVVRVPQSRFLAFTTQIDARYDVLHRQIEAQDVGEEFRDVEIRIRNLEVMRDRVAALLTSATDVEQALAVEQQLERITAELESLRGRQRFLADRITFSTVTVMFRPQPHDAIDQPEVFQLPFAWLEGLGLPNLMELR